MSQTDPRDSAKRASGIAAAAMVQPGWVVGLGTGTTTAFAIEELGRRVREENVRFEGIPTSHSSEILARQWGIPIRTLQDVDGIDLAIDGADEVDGDKNVMKGSGGAHTREKIIDSFAKIFVVVADDTKMVTRLGEGRAVPIEVIPLAVPSAQRDLEAMGATVTLRFTVPDHGHTGPVITDQGNFVLDAKFDGIDDPAEMERRLNAIPGVLENGIFPKKAHTIIVASTTDGSITQID